MGIYTSSYLKNLSSDRNLLSEDKFFSAQDVDKNSFDIFLSHSFLDNQEVRGLFIELTNLGYSVYVDWIVDPQLDRNNVTKETAELIRSRMKNSKSLLLAISENADMSKWIPWELGFVDGNTNRCAILPVSRQKSGSKTFEGKEYLKLYPFLKKAPSYFKASEELWVVESEFAYSEFKNWYNTGKIEKNNTQNIFNL